MDYRLDLKTLLLMLGQSSGSLDADLAHIQGMRGRAHVQLRLENGRVHACTITDTNGTTKYTGETALKLVQDLVLAWHYIEEPVSPSTTRNQAAPGRSLLPLSPIPRRTSLSVPENFSAWPRLYRNVYSLVNGVVTVNQIARTIAPGQDPSAVYEAITQLQLAGFIVLESR